MNREQHFCVFDCHVYPVLLETNNNNYYHSLIKAKSTVIYFTHFMLITRQLQTIYVIDWRTKYNSKLNRICLIQKKIFAVKIKRKEIVSIVQIKCKILVYFSICGINKIKYQNGSRNKYFILMYISYGV